MRPREHHVLVAWRRRLLFDQVVLDNSTRWHDFVHLNRLTTVRVDTWNWQLINPTTVGERSIAMSMSVCVLRYDTIRDASLTCARKPTWVSLICRTETTAKKCKTEKLKSKNGICSEVTVFVCPWAYLRLCTSNLCQLLCMLPMAWLGPPHAASRYGVYFRFYGWRHICT